MVLAIAGWMNRQQMARTLTLELGKGVTMKLIQIPPGKFVMGSREDNADASRSEKPQHTVELAAYYIGRTPVTKEMKPLAIIEGSLRSRKRSWRSRRQPLTRYQAARFAKALHHPVALTCLPAKRMQGPKASPALPW